MNQQTTMMRVAIAALAGQLLARAAAAQDPLHEVYFHDLARNKVGNVIVVQTNPETEVLVFNGGELALDGDNLIIVARHARVDADTVIRSFRRTAAVAKQGSPDQAPRGDDGANPGEPGGDGLPGLSGVPGDNGDGAGKIVLRIGEISGKGRLIVSMA